MPLTDEQQEIRDELVKRTKILVDEIPGYEKFTRQAAALDHLKTGGQQPDYDSLSDQQVADIFDAGRLNPSINGLADVDLEHRFGQINLQEKGITSNRGPESVPKGPDVPATREYMVEAIDTWMQHENNALNPRLVIQAQMGIADSPGVVLGGKLEKATFDYMHLQDAMKEAGVPEYHDPEIEANLAQLKAAEKQFNQAAKDFKAQAPNMAAKEGLEFAAQMQFTPEQVADEVRECSLLDIGNPPSINGANLSGLDLSKSDLSGLRVDAATLSKASGLEQVQGVDPELKAAAIEQHPEAVKVARVQQKVQASPAGQAAGREAPRGIPEPGKISGPDDLAGVSANEMKGAMQASETFQVKAAQGKVIGEGGESMGYAKLQVGERSKILQGQSMASKQSLVDAGFDLAALNKLSSPYNSLVDFEKKLAETKDPVLKKSYQDRIDNTWQRIDDLLEEGLANVPEQNRAQVEALLPEYKKVQIAHSGSQQADSTSRGAANALFKPETGYGQGFDESKVAEIDKTFLGRSVASYETDKLIGTDVCSEEKLAVNGEGQLMGISVAADGAQVSRISPVEIDGKNDLTTRMLRTDYASHEVQKGLYDWRRWTTSPASQIDRHPGNIAINPDSGSVKGIDNDLAFPEDDRANVAARKQGRRQPADVHAQGNGGKNRRC
ncbi:MAG: hypothetical protein R3F13_14670 [Prosthecobacter sp.]